MLQCNTREHEAFTFCDTFLVRSSAWPYQSWEISLTDSPSPTWCNLKYQEGQHGQWLRVADVIVQQHLEGTKLRKAAPGEIGGNVFFWLQDAKIQVGLQGALM